MCCDFFGNTRTSANTDKTVENFVPNCPWTDVCKNEILLKNCIFSKQDKNMKIQTKTLTDILSMTVHVFSRDPYQRITLNAGFCDTVP